VLLVDDDPVARLLTAAALGERGWTVIEADGGAQALTAFAQHRPDIVVLDALMPQIDGFATCERLRKLPGGEHVPVLMLTGLDDEESIARAFEAGATDFLVKGSSPWSLLSHRLRYMLRASRLRDQLAEQTARLGHAQRVGQIGTWRWDIALRRVQLSSECLEIAGLQAQGEELGDWAVWRLVPDDERLRVQSMFRAALAGAGTLDFECRIVRPDGETRTLHVEAEIARDAGGGATAVFGAVQDVSERRRTEETIRRLVNFDGLTGLPNRSHFRDQAAANLDWARATGTSVAFVAIGIDRFKQINETLGYQTGDAVLREAARRLFLAVRESDTVARATQGADTVARLGGDEFTVVLTDLKNAGAAESVARRLLEALRAPMVCDGHEVFITASIGVALFPQHGDDVETLLRKAEIAMRAVKDAGRNGWQVYDDAMNTATAERWRLETALHRALERNELVLHYQPRVDVLSGRVVGAEALMRWQRGDDLIAPAEFIALAEETGLIVPITEWAIAEVCRQIARWRDAGIAPVPVSVNISSRHVQRADLVAPVARALEASGLSAALLELELTETVLMHNLSAALPLLQALKQLGVSISIDDFGTGYSSLAYLKRLPIDTLKIDRSFVRELESSGDNAAIVAAIIAMARSLKLRVVAEGVETRAQMQALLAEGCHLMQGWLFARALPADDMAALLRDGGRDPGWPVAELPELQYGAGRARAAEAGHASEAGPEPKDGTARAAVSVANSRARTGR
jgi:diguanylate cyclase (GGDEF)-like protein/PAS domain S-box-containing protein